MQGWKTGEIIYSNAVYTLICVQIYKDLVEYSSSRANSYAGSLQLAMGHELAACMSIHSQDEESYTCIILSYYSFF